MIKLVEIVADGSDRTPMEKVVTEQLAVKMLAKSKNWAIHSDEKKVFQNGEIYDEGKAPKVEVEGVHLVSREGQERFVEDIELAEKMVAKSVKKKLWNIDTNKEKIWKFDEKSLKLVKKARNQSAPKKPAGDNKE